MTCRIKVVIIRSATVCLGEMESVSNKPAKDINLIKENPPSPIRRGSTRVTDY